MKERPIIFSAPMVRAILAGTKTQTRRVIKLPYIEFLGSGNKSGEDWNDPSCWGSEDQDGMFWCLAPGVDVDHVFPCRYGKPGDRLWVRETYRDRAIGESGFADRAGYVYRATENVDGLAERWKSPIHMPRSASRTLLEVTDVRVQRVQDISDADAGAEGMGEYAATSCRCSDNTGVEPSEIDPAGWYELFWSSINGRASWDANPWVWAVSFKRVLSA